MNRFWLILILATTLLWAEKPDPKAVVGKIDDKTYTYAEYEKILIGYYDYYTKQQGTPLTDEDKAKYNDRCWEELVGRYIYDKAIKAGKIKITNQELLNEAKQNPPAAVKEIKDFYTNGRFDQTKYNKALAEATEFRQAVLDEVRAMYQYSKLLKTVRNEVDADEDSVRQAWMQDQERLDAQIIFFDANKLTTISANEQEARMYYDGRKEEYRKDNCRRLHYVKFAKVATAADTLAVRERVWQMYQDLLTGADFDSLARAESQDPGSAQNGGDLGWFGRGRMVKPFEDAAFATPNGQLAEPVLSQFGWHIIQTMDRRTTEAGEEVSARHILIRVEPGAQTVQKMKSDSQQLYDKAKTEGLPAAAAALGFTLEETPVFQDKDSFIRNIGREAGLIRFAFENPVGSVADILYSASGDIFVCAVSAELPVYYTPFEDEQQNIQNSATRSKRGFYMNQYVQNFVSTLLQEEYLPTADKDSLLVVELKDHKKGDNITSIGKQAALEEALFSTPEGSFTPLISEQMRWFIARVDRHVKPDLAIWDKEKSRLMQAAREDVQQKHLNEWYRGQWQQVSIIDNRRDFYDLPSNQQMIKLGN